MPPVCSHPCVLGGRVDLVQLCAPPQNIIHLLNPVFVLWSELNDFCREQKIRVGTRIKSQQSHVSLEVGTKHMSPSAFSHCLNKSLTCRMSTLTHFLAKTLDYLQVPFERLLLSQSLFRGLSLRSNFHVERSPSCWYQAIAVSGSKRMKATCSHVSNRWRMRT